MRSLFLFSSVILLCIVLVNCDKKSKNNGENGLKNVDPPKKFIGRIEHGKVKVLRTKKTDDEFCSKKGENCEEEEENSSEEPKRKKIKYSIKFQHEKQKKTERNGEVNIMRLHKNSRKKYGKHDSYDDDDSSEEDDSPIKKRFRELDDDE